MFTKEMLKVLDRLKLKLILSNTNFLSSLLVSLDIKDTQDAEFKCDTACTNGIDILINQDWFLKLTEEFQEIVLLHEVLHVAKLHPLRGKEMREHDIANIACDIIVNRDIIKLGYSRKLLESFGAVVNSHYEDKSEEEIYLELISKTKNRNKDDSKPCNGGLGGSGSGNELNNLKAIEGDLQMLDPKVAADKVSSLINKVTNAISMAKSNGWGIPEGIEQFMDSFIHPKLPWNILLRKYLSDLIPGMRRTWSRPNRRYPDVYRPSKDRERNNLKNVMIFIDSSGSVTDDELSEYISEIRHLHKKLQPKNLSIIEFDTVIRKEVSYKPRAKIDSFIFNGRGGTNYSQIMQLIKERNPEFAIIFTDLFCNIPERPNILLISFGLEQVNINQDLVFLVMAS